MNLTVLVPLRPSAMSFWVLAGVLLGVLAWLRADPDYVPMKTVGESRRNTSDRNADF